MIYENVFQYVIDSDIISSYRTDHSAIILKLKFQENDREKKYWEFNNSLLKYKKYVDTIKKVIEDVKQTYSINIRLCENSSIYMHDQLFLETLLMIIRGNTIKFS